MKIPKICSEYVNVYIPKSDVYLGNDSKSFTYGKTYNNWEINDHTLLKGNDGCFHSFGITHPVVSNMEGIHEAEWQSFHAVTKVGNFVDFFKEDSFLEKPKILYPKDRPNESESQHSPTIVLKDDTYYMFYGPCAIRYAISKDLYNWIPKGAVFTDHKTSRDPHLYFENGVYHMTYCVKNYVVMRTSTDLLNWSDSVKIFEMTTSGEPESPVILKYDDMYYLVWCLWDETDPTCDPYCDESFVYASTDIFDFKNKKVVATLKAHCPEFFVDENGDYYISSAHKPCVGLNVAKIEWI